MERVVVIVTITVSVIASVTISRLRVLQRRRPRDRLASSLIRTPRGSRRRLRCPDRVAEAAHRVDQRWGIDVDLAPQVGDEAFDHVAVAAEVVLPQLVEDLGL